jgi:hypothetical protein
MAEREPMTKRELIEAAYAMTGGNFADLTTEQVEKLMTITQFVTDLCLDEIERRGALDFLGGVPVVPYVSEHGVKTILTR